MLKNSYSSKALEDNDKIDPDEDDSIEGTIGAGYFEVASDGTIINDEFKRFRFEVGKENIELHMATKALNNLDRCQLTVPMEDGTYH